MDPAHTRIAFSIDAVGFPRTDGTFRRFAGRIGVDLQQPARSCVAFRVEAASADVGSELLGGLLRGESFLDAGRFPEIAFTSRSVTKIDDFDVLVVGDMTILGVTRPLSVDVAVRRLSEKPPLRLAFVANATIDRLQFGMREGYPLISKDVRLVVISEAAER